jgi:hypothetical protein
MACATGKLEIQGFFLSAPTFQHHLGVPSSAPHTQTCLKLKTHIFPKIDTFGDMTFSILSSTATGAARPAMNSGR